ncbi:MAG: hypothetical protein MRJ92_01875 [Nitrospira sp.]|nr:hypothetical protein [Nitrospira sp.]
MSGCVVRHHLRNRRERNVNFYGHVTQSFGGYGIVTGQRIGLFGASCTVPTLVNPDLPDLPGRGRSGQPSLTGVDVSLDVEWGMESVRGLDVGQRQQKHVCVAGHCRRAKRSRLNGAQELDHAPALLPFFEMPDWFFAYRYDLIRNNRQGDPTFAKNYNNVDSHTVLVRYYPSLDQDRPGAPCGVQQLSQTGGKSNGGDLLGQTMLVGFDFAY